MPYEIKTKDGIVIRGIPDDVRPDDPRLKMRAEAARGSQRVEAARGSQGVPATPQGATTMQRIQASVPMRLIQGFRDPIDAGAQMLSRLVPDAVTDALDYIPSRMRGSDNPLISGFANAYLADPRPRAIDKNIRETEQQYQAAREATAPVTLDSLITGKKDPGMDVARFTGQIFSPANAALAKTIPAAAMITLPRMAATGTFTGAVGSALNPITDEREQNEFLKNKAIQTGVGAAVGAVATPVISKVIQAVAPYVERVINKITGTSQVAVERAGLEADRILTNALRDVGHSIDDMPKAQYDALRKQVNDALKSGVKLDAAALLRKSDFDAAGLPATLGQITRDPQQFARERNLRGVAGVGEPLMARFHGQNQQIQQDIGAFAKGASDKVTAGERLAQALAQTDEKMRSAVSGAYKAARESAGKDLDIPMAGIAQDVTDISKRYGNNLPSGIKNMFDDFGLFSGRQTKIFTMEDAEAIIQQANKLRGNDPATNSALSEITNSLKKAIIETSAEGGPFAAPRALAAQRFSMQDAVPALKAAANNEVAADDFVRKFVLNAPTEQVKKMAQILSDPARQEAKAQIGATIQRAAFGENMAGDKILAPERLAKALRDLGPQKLSAFFDTAEIDQLNRLARVGAYINSTPTAAAVNTSNTAATAMNLASQIPGGEKLRLLAAVTQPIINQRAVNNAMNAAVPQSANVSPDAVRKARLASALAGIGVGNATGSAFR
tara:strand:- start:419 stop:2602 length:2184 start_codon:yes stop_codon:yes gene_type:complete